MASMIRRLRRPSPSLFRTQTLTLKSLLQNPSSPMDCPISTASVHFDNRLVSPFRPLIKTLTLAPLSPCPSVRPQMLSPFRVFSISSPNPTPSPIDKTIRTSATSASILSDHPPPTGAGQVQETESVPETIGSLASLAYQKLEEGEDVEALAILNRLMSHQPSETEWKFLAAEIHTKMGEPTKSRKLYEEILSIDPSSCRALFGNAILMNNLGEGRAALKRLEKALEVARLEQNQEAVRNVRLSIALIKTVQDKVDEAMEEYAELIKEDPKDQRPYLSRAGVFSLLGRHSEARETLVKLKEHAPEDFDVDACLQTLPG